MKIFTVFRFLGALATLLKATVSSVTSDCLSVRPSVRPSARPTVHWTDFLEIRYCSIFLTFVEKNQG
jgi:hypothetical protein